MSRQRCGAQHFAQDICAKALRLGCVVLPEGRSVSVGGKTRSLTTEREGPTGPDRHGKGFGLDS